VAFSRALHLTIENVQILNTQWTFAKMQMVILMTVPPKKMPKKNLKIQ
jgi:hypothetical protein